MLAIAEEGRGRAACDHGRCERRDSGAVLDRKGGREKVADAEAKGTLDAVTVTGAGAALVSGGFPATALVASPLLGATAATMLIPAFRAGSLGVAGLSRLVLAGRRLALLNDPLG